MYEDMSALGARNLLLNCAEAKAGDRLLIALEPSDLGFFADDAFECVLGEAVRLGLTVESVNVGFHAENPHLPKPLLRGMASYDIILFLARLGDQLRFSDMPRGKRIIVSFALNAHLLGTGFGTANHSAFVALKSAVNSALSNAGEIRISCPAGTEVVGKTDIELTPAVDTSILRFPMSVFTPVPATKFDGRVALPGFLTGAGSRYYDDYTVDFDGQVYAMLDRGRLAGFEGSPSDVDRANRHYDRVAALFGIDRNFVHSWHAGIHPGCGFAGNAGANYQRWGMIAFGNPRILHFHTCGEYAPGEISWNVIDPTVEADGIKYWENGSFRADRLSGGARILRRHPDAAGLFRNPDRNIGIADATQRLLCRGGKTW